VPYPAEAQQSITGGTAIVPGRFSVAGSNEKSSQRCLIRGKGARGKLDDLNIYTQRTPPDSGTSVLYARLYGSKTYCLFPICYSLSPGGKRPAPFNLNRTNSLLDIWPRERPECIR
jgi:hypothetical protein